MKRGGDGWFTADIAGVKAGARYKFRIDDEVDVAGSCFGVSIPMMSRRQRGDRSCRLCLAGPGLAGTSVGRGGHLSMHVGTFSLKELAGRCTGWITLRNWASPP